MNKGKGDRIEEADYTQAMFRNSASIILTKGMVFFFFNYFIM